MTTDPAYEGTAAPGSNLAKLQILIADDSSFFINILKDILRSYGIRDVFSGRGGRHAIEHVKMTPLDMAIVEINMSEVGGFDVVDFIRKSPEAPNNQMPVIMMSGNPTRDMVTRAMDAGAEEFLAKPVRSVDVFQRIRHILDNPRAYVFGDNGYFGPMPRRPHNRFAIHSLPIPAGRAPAGELPPAALSLPHPAARGTKQDRAWLI